MTATLQLRAPQFHPKPLGPFPGRTVPPTPTRLLHVHTDRNPITVWEVFRNDGWHHNHIEDGHSNNDKPEPRHPNQKVWRGWQSRKIHATLDRGVVRKPRAN